MSGVKGLSGRQPDAAVKELRAQMDEIISPDDWRAIWRAVVVAAGQGHIPAIKLLVRCRYGPASAYVRPIAGVCTVASGQTLN